MHPTLWHRIHAVNAEAQGNWWVVISCCEVNQDEGLK